LRQNLRRQPVEDGPYVGEDVGGVAVNQRLLRFPAVKKIPLLLTFAPLCRRNHTGLRSAIPNSRNCLSGAGDGASHITSDPPAVLGNGITSRIEVSPARIITRRSRPSAIPPCGGAPCCSASSRRPNIRCAYSGVN